MPVRDMCEMGARGRQDARDSMFTETEMGQALREIRARDPAFDMVAFLRVLRRGRPLGCWTFSSVKAEDCRVLHNLMPGYRTVLYQTTMREHNRHALCCKGFVAAWMPSRTCGQCGTFRASSPGRRRVTAERSQAAVGTCRW